MTLQGTSRQYMLQLLSQHPDWHVLDVGAGSIPVFAADVATDVMNHEKLYENYSAEFIQTDSLKSFGDNQFDFIWASHVLEHVSDPSDFLQELQRVGRSGYIEVPTPLFCNLSYGNVEGHVSWVQFDPAEANLKIAPRGDVLKPILSGRELSWLNRWFRTSMVQEIYWNDSIEFEVVTEIRFPSEEHSYAYSESWCVDIPAEGPKFPASFGSLSKSDSLKVRLARSRIGSRLLQ